MRTLEVEFGEKAHIGILERFTRTEEDWQVEEIASQYGGSVCTVEDKVEGIERFTPRVGGPAVKIELRTNANGAEVEYSPQSGRNRDFPPCIQKLDKPGATYPVLVGDPTGNRNVVSKAYVVVR